MADRKAKTGFLRIPLYAAPAAAEAAAFPKTLGKISAAIDGYVDALVNRQDGNIALDRAFQKVCEAMGREPTAEMDMRRRALADFTSPAP